MSESEETPTQKQARLRRERRNAKLQAGGSSRLASIMNSSGRQHAAEAEAATARPITPAAQSTSDLDDPAVMDIAEHHYQPQPRRIGTPGAGTPPIGGPFAHGTQAQQMPPPSEDPMFAMLQQMMAGGGMPGGAGGPGGADPNAQLPPGLANVFGAAGFPGMPGQDQASQQQQAPSSSAYLWRILHFIISLLLSLYVALNTTFNGSKRARDLSILTSNSPLSLERDFSTQLFYLFATAEVVLQSSRYFIEKGQLTQSGLMGTLSQVLPEPWAGYVRVVGRYSVIYTTVVADAMVVVFVLGAMAWWRNGALGGGIS